MKIYDVTDERFHKYGKVVKKIDFATLVEARKTTPVPEDVVYEPRIEEFMKLPVAEEMRLVFY